MQQQQKQIGQTLNCRWVFNLYRTPASPGTVFRALSESYGTNPRKTKCRAYGSHQLCLSDDTRYRSWVCVSVLKYMSYEIMCLYSMCAHTTPNEQRCRQYFTGQEYIGALKRPDPSELCSIPLAFGFFHPLLPDTPSSRRILLFKTALNDLGDLATFIRPRPPI